MPRYSNKKKRGKNKFLVGLLVVGVLAALFFASFFVTSFVLDMNNKNSEDAEIAEESSTPELTYEELEEMVKEKDDKIKELEKELERYRGKSDMETESQTEPDPIVSEQTTSTPKPSATATPKPTQTPAPQPTGKPSDSGAEQPDVNNGGGEISEGVE